MDVNESTPESIRVTRHGKIAFWVRKALDFFESHPDRPLVLYSESARVSASSIGRLISVVEIIKREYLQRRDLSAGDVSGLHQYNKLLDDRRSDDVHRLLDGHAHPQQSFAPHMQITLSVKPIEDRRETHQAPAVRRMSKAAKSRMKRRMRAEGQISCQS